MSGLLRGQNKVLILKFKNSDLFSLPAGTVLKEEDVDFSAHRVLKETTGLQNHYLQHFGTFGKSNRVNKDHIEKILKGFGVHKIEDHFMSQRFVAVGYLALVDIKKVQLSPDPFSDYLKWFPIDNIPSLIHDHNDILKDSLAYLKNNIYQTPIIQYLMPEAFTMKELQMLYERILNEKLVRTNFQRWILGKNILERLDKLYTGKAHKAPYQYRFKK
jgi:8-oxo-dGTP diphosphatase